jgi:hypothetical protein
MVLGSGANMQWIYGDISNIDFIPVVLKNFLEG